MEVLGIITLLACLLVYGLYNGYGLLRDARLVREASRSNTSAAAQDESVPSPLSPEDITRRAQELRDHGWTVEVAADQLSLLAHKSLHPRRA